MITPSSCFYSSFIFLVNVILCALYDYDLYALLFFMLWVTSIIVHLYTNLITILIDKISIILVVLYGGGIFFEKCKPDIDIFYILSIIATFLITIYLYYFGYLCKKYCFCENKEIANIWHSILHIISSIGHGLIVFL